VIVLEGEADLFEVIVTGALEMNYDKYVNAFMRKVFKVKSP
jgi:hypothetical protein